MVMEEDFFARGIIRVPFKCKLLATLFFCSTVGETTLALILFYRPSYLASAQLMVISNGDQGLNTAPIRNLSTPTARVTFTMEEYTARSAAILTGTALAQLVVRSMDADELYSHGDPP